MTGFRSKQEAALDKLVEVTEELGLYDKPVNKDEALKLALEALMRSRKSVSGDLDMAGCAYGRNDPDGHRYDDAKKALETLKQAITAIKEALAHPAETDWRAAYKEAVRQHSMTLDELREALAQPAQEPVECMCGLCKLGTNYELKEKNNGSR